MFNLCQYTIQRQHEINGFTKPREAAGVADSPSNY